MTEPANIAVVRDEELNSPENVIADVVSALRADHTTDSDLLNILDDHIATMNPGEGAVQKAERAIVELAFKRAGKQNDDDNS